MIQNTIMLGYDTNGKKIKLSWGNSNGILCAGIPGSGKSQTVALYLSQYAYNGAKIILCDYNAALGTSETLLQRIEHLSPAFILPPATTRNKIVEYIQYVKRIGDARYSGEDIDTSPIIFVIDEFPAFLMDYEPEQTITTRVSGDRFSEEGEQRKITKAIGFIEELVSSILKFRKVNIHYILAGQEWAQMGTSGVRPLRSNITDKVLHRMDNAQSLLFGITDSETRRMMQHYITGAALYNDIHLTIPLLKDNHIREVREKIGYAQNIPVALHKRTSSVWTPEDTYFFNEMKKTYGDPIEKRVDQAFEDGKATALRTIEIETVEDLILHLLKIGKSATWIREVLRGRTKDLTDMIKVVKDKYGFTD